MLWHLGTINKYGDNTAQEVYKAPCHQADGTETDRHTNPVLYLSIRLLRVCLLIFVIL